MIFNLFSDVCPDVLLLEILEYVPNDALFGI